MDYKERCNSVAEDGTNAARVIDRQRHRDWTGGVLQEIFELILKNVVLVRARDPEITAGTVIGITSGESSKGRRQNEKSAAERQAAQQID